MSRKKIQKCIRPLDYDKYFKPAGLFFEELLTSELLIEEFEAIRLADDENLSQIEGAQKMGVSRATFQRLLKSGREKIIDALIHNKAIKINKD